MPEPSTRLFLILPPIADAFAFRPVLAAALKAGDVACVLLRSGQDVKAIAQALMPLVQEHDAAFLVEGDPRLVARTGADGVHVAYSANGIESALSSLGADAIVGAGALATRDEAMSAGELGASYVMFGEPDAGGARPSAEHTLERVAWWAEIFNVPCVAYAGSLDEVGPLAEARAEFVALADVVWKHPAGPAEAIKEANTLLANAVLTA
ncbi:MAG TPA: thiamine phosphate synthase [Beijerinckiaceae bacterium]|jgi:thiamine-phosphate pyrophosphorylase|nr:thiamine phosphate synthase [Beijerinckiaceae bacterium]